MLEALEFGHLEVSDDGNRILITAYAGPTGKTEYGSIYVPLVKMVEEYHFPQLSGIWEYLEMCNEPLKLYEQLRAVVKEAVRKNLKDAPSITCFQKWKETSDFEWTLEKAVYDFLKSNLHRIHEWDWKHDFEKSFESFYESTSLVVQFNTFVIYRESAHQHSTTPETSAFPVKVLVYSILDSLINDDEQIKSLSVELKNIHEECSRKRGPYK